MRWGHLFMPVAVGLTVGAAILSLKQLNPGKDPARVPAADPVVYVSTLPAGYVGPGCSMATSTKDSAGRYITVVMTYVCSMPTAAASFCPSGTVQASVNGSLTPVCDHPQK